MKSLIYNLLLASALTASAHVFGPVWTPPLPTNAPSPIHHLSSSYSMMDDAGGNGTNQQGGHLTVRITIQPINCTFSGNGIIHGPVPSTFSATNTNVVYMDKSWSGGTQVYAEYDIPHESVAWWGIGLSGYCPIITLNQAHSCLRITGKATFVDGSTTNWTLVCNLPAFTDSFYWSASIYVQGVHNTTNDVMVTSASVTDYHINPFAPWRPPHIIPPTVVPNTNLPPRSPGTGNPYAQYAFEFVTDIGTNENWSFVPDPTVKQITYYNLTNLTYNVYGSSNLSNWVLYDNATADTNGLFEVFESSTNAQNFYRISTQ